MEKGYKLHTLIDNAGRVLSWRLTPMNADEGRVCVRLLGGVPEGVNGYILGDGSYNDNKLFAAARVRGLQLVSPRRVRSPRVATLRAQLQESLRAADAVPAAASPC
jgi:hypothetical protein